jgi:glutamine amidotransferase
MQLFTKNSEEGILPGLGWINCDTVKFNFGENQKNLKIPHMGWNYILAKQKSKLFNGMPEEPRFYFVHSYHLSADDESFVLATTNYGYEFPSIVIKDNIIGAQFHPEKSHKFGMQLLKNFVEHF